jgi:hypothetical protein
VHIALLLAGYAIGLSVWVGLAWSILRRVIVAARWGAGAVARRRGPVLPAAGGAEVVPLPARSRAPAPVPVALFDQRAA